MKGLMIKNAIAATLVFACTLVASAAVNRYVNADIGDDDKYDGSSPTVVSDTEGPKKTLMGALSRAKDGDTVYAAAGVYSNGVYEADGYRYRAHVTGGVTLVGEGPDKTFIVGAKDLEAGHAEGCGPNAVACVYLEYTAASKKGGIIQGFSVSGGRSCASSSGRAVGIAGNSAWNLAVDCVISNNYNVYRGGGVSSISCARCVFAGNNRAGNVPGSGTAHGPQGFINCVFYPGEAGMYNSDGGWSFFNCTIGCSFYTSRAGSEVTCKNCVIYQNHSTHHYYNCLLLKHVSGTAEPDCRDVTADELKLDANYVPQAGSIAIGGCTNDYYTAALSTFWNVAALDKEHDVVGSPRQMGGEIDIGAGEYDWRKPFAADLAARNVTVTDVTPNVVETTEKKVSVPAAGSMTVVWTASAAHKAEELDYLFTAKVTDGATLTVTRGGATLVTATTADGEKTWTFKGTGDQELVFAVTGEDGAAELSGFSNSTLVTIADGQDGVTITGAAKGENELVAGQTITLARNYTTKKLCMGVNVNGEFFSFTGADADAVYTKTIAAGDADLVIQAVYAEHNTWYVDASAEDDSADGRTPYRPKKTLQAAMEIEGLESGDTVFAAAGRYDEGQYDVMNGETLKARYRVALKDGIVLEGAGADKTFIVGRIDTTVAEGQKGCGPNGIRGVKMPGGSIGSVLKGVTVCEGRTLNGSDYSNIGGGLNGFGNNDYVVDCVISNNAAYRGGGAQGGRYVNCLFVDNLCVNTGANGGYDLAVCWNCRFVGQGVYAPDLRNATFYNCTSDTSIWSSSGEGYYVYFYNCLFKTGIQTMGRYRSCLLTGTLAGAFEVDDRTKQVTSDELALGANDVPQSGSVAIDYGSNTVYEASLPTTHWAYDRLGFVRDVAGSQRVYNAAIDVGACEYDWRGDYARKLSGGRRLSVVAATPGVTNAVDGVVLTPEASAVTLSWDGKVAGRATLATTVSGEGALTVMANGVAVAPDAEGSYAFDLPEGLTKIDVSFAGTGSARLVSFDGPKAGLLLLVR